jgi:uncharacterized protein YecE (DUF72 family)
MAKTGTIRVGIGGWSFEPWRETFYPDKLAKAKELSFASREVTAIEINATFYRTQAPSTYQKWAAETPDDFVFAVKANRFTVNRKNLADGAESVARFLASGMTELGPKLGPILWQLAGTKKFDPDEIETFCASLPHERDGMRMRHVLEVRHQTFVEPRLVEIARKHNVAICLAHSDDYPLIADPTADFCYLRLQTTQDIETGYDADEIATWAKRCKDLAAGRPAEGLPLLGPKPKAVPRDVFVFMISGAKHRNPAAAKALIAALGDRA